MERVSLRSSEMRQRHHGFCRRIANSLISIRMKSSSFQIKNTMILENHTGQWEVGIRRSLPAVPRPGAESVLFWETSVVSNCWLVGTQVWSKIEVMLPAAIKWLSFKPPTIDFYTASLHTSDLQCKSSNQNPIPGGWIPDRYALKDREAVQKLSNP